MNGRLRFDLKPIQRGIKALAPQVKKSRRELAEEAARGFVKEVVAITPPASKGKRGNAAKKAGEGAIIADLARVMVAAARKKGVTLSDPAEIHNTGVAVGDLVVLQQEFANAGKTAEDIGPVFGKMAKTLHGDSAALTVEKLGLKLEDLKKQTPAEQFRTLGKAINSVRDPSQRAAISMELFGRSGAELLSLFSSDGFGDAAEQVGSQAAILQRDASLFDDISDKLALTGMKVRGFWIGLADKVAPVLKPLIDRFANLDLAKWGSANTGSSRCAAQPTPTADGGPVAAKPRAKC